MLLSSLGIIIIRIPRSCSTTIVYAAPHSAQHCWPLWPLLISGVHPCSGLTWSPPRRTKIPNNNASIQANKLHSSTFNRTAAQLNDSLVLVFDNTNRSCNFKDCTHRNPLSIALSYDKGESWPFVRDLEYVASSVVSLFTALYSTHLLNTLNSRGHGKRRYGNSYPEGPTDPDPGRTEYSYPTVVQGQDGLLHVSHSYNRDTIKYQQVSEAWVQQGGTVGMFKGDK